MTLRDHPAPASAGNFVRAPIPGMGWPDLVLTAAAAVGLFAAIHSWFSRHSGIAGESGTLLVIVASALILFGLAVALSVRSHRVRRLFDGLILLGTVLTALAAWFLMSWVLLGAMIVAAVAQIARLARPRF